MAAVLENYRDFQLYPKDPLSLEMSDNNYFLSADDFQAMDDMAVSTFDSYPSFNAFAPNDNNPQVVLDEPKDSAKPKHYTPSDSPATTMSHSMEHSGAYSHQSGPSTTSSQANSPYSHHTSAFPGHQDSWTENAQGAFQQGLPQGLGIVQVGMSESLQNYDFSGAEQDSIYENKFNSNFVGELTQNSSYPAASPVLSSPVSSSSCSTSQSIASAIPSPVSMNMHTDSKSHMIGAILEEPRGRMLSPIMHSPLSTTSSIQTSPLSAHDVRQLRWPEQQHRFFRAPSTPASANIPSAQSATPPFALNIHHRTVTHENSPAPMSPHHHQRSPSPMSPKPAHGNVYYNPFFNQSSGRYVPPLESSYPTLISTYDQLPGVSTTAMPSYTPVNQFYPYAQPPSPAPSQSSVNSMRRQSRNNSPAIYPYPMSKKMSNSPYSYSNHPSPNFDDGKETKRCPHPDCGRHFKDLKAHMLTHQSERPEKCPIVTCEYHTKGFARKYDRCRHTLTHYKGTMVCDFCPGGGSAAEKSFNRADVFKRHLTSVHGVEQAPPNSRKKAPVASKKAADSKDTSGKCSTCNSVFNNAQDLYDHLDECVLKSLEQEEPSEGINARHLTNVAQDKDVKETLEKHMLPTETTEAQDDEEFDDEDASDDNSALRTANSRSGKGGIRSVGIKTAASKGRKKRKAFPNSWGCAPDQMKMRKRVLCVFEGPNRLVKDEMMLDSEYEVRVYNKDKNPGELRRGEANSYVTDLDVRTMQRAQVSELDFQTVKRARGFIEASKEDIEGYVEPGKEITNLALQ